MLLYNKIWKTISQSSMKELRLSCEICQFCCSINMHSRDYDDDGCQVVLILLSSRHNRPFVVKVMQCVVIIFHDSIIILFFVDSAHL